MFRFTVCNGIKGKVMGAAYCMHGIEDDEHRVLSEKPEKRYTLEDFIVGRS
jgi:hypothetical protein